MPRREQTIPADLAGLRLDKALADLLPEVSRSRLQALAKEGRIRVDGTPAKPSLKLEAGQVVVVDLPEVAPSTLEGEAIPLDILFEDEHLLAVNKPPGMVVHPAPGHDSGTLVHALLAHCDDLSGIGGEERPGILHRLDKKTSGVIVIAKHDRAHVELSRQFQDREVQKVYRAVVTRRCKEIDYTADEPIGRDPRNRKKMTQGGVTPREAHTRVRVLAIMDQCTEVAAYPTTGRTHQIRVHLWGLGHPVLNDDLYGLPNKRIKGQLAKVLKNYPGYLLHAWRLSVVHPVTGEALAFEAPLPDVFRKVRAVAQSIEEIPES